MTTKEMTTKTTTTHYRFHYHQAYAWDDDEPPQNLYATHKTIEGAARNVLIFMIVEGEAREGIFYPIPWMDDDGNTIVAGEDYEMDTPAWIPHSWCDQEIMTRPPYPTAPLKKETLIGMMRDEVMQTGRFRLGGENEYCEIVPVEVALEGEEEGKKALA